MLKGVFGDGLMVPLIKGFFILNVHVEGYKALLWSSLVFYKCLSHIGGLSSPHFQPKQLLVTVMVFGLPFCG